MNQLTEVRGKVQVADVDVPLALLADLDDQMPATGASTTPRPKPTLPPSGKFSVGEERQLIEARKLNSDGTLVV